ncbi:MAG: response regulator transcription factor [Chloroflexi bacterium]|jgi:DNA-binding NarL/FixJ family response regulator|nr:response regulator transcription factor [Chloroflexota bacterium]
MNTLNDQPERPQKVLVIDDQILFREGLISLVRSTTDFEAVGYAGSVHEGIEQALLHKPDIILMDFSLPDGTGLDATSAIRSHLPDCKIIFLTVYETEENLFAALRIGAKGYMLKNVTSSDLLAGLRALSRGEKAISRQMMSSVLDEFSRTLPVSSAGREKLLSRLSPRELDVLHELEQDASNLQIAQRLFLSENTVKHHIRNILDKLEVENRREAISFVRQNSVGISL